MMTFVVVLNTLKCEIWSWDLQYLLLKVTLKSKWLSLVLDVDFMTLTILKLVYSLLGEITPSYILHTRAFGTYLLGGGYLPCKKYHKVMIFYM